MTTTSVLLTIKKILRRMGQILLFLLLVWWLAVQAGCFSMRSSDAEWSSKLQKAGQSLAPVFFDVAAPSGRKIHGVYIAASDTLPLVVLSHGSPGASDAFVPYLSDTILTRKFRLVCYDRPGFGYSSGFGTPEPSLAAQAAAVKAVADRFAPGRQVFLMGHSMGGPVIERFAMDYPERTAGLVIIAGSIDPDLEPHPWWQKAIHVPPLSWLMPSSFWASNAEIIPLEQELREMMPLWEKINCPARVVHAQNDRLVPVGNAEFARKMLKNCPDLRIHLLPDGDHFILWTRKDVIKNTLEELPH